MAEVTSILREMQLGTEGGLVVPARDSVPLYSRRLSKLAKDDSAAIGATMARKRLSKLAKDDSAAIGATMARNKDVGSMGKARSWSDFGSELGPKEARNKDVGSMGKARSWSDFGSELGPKEERKAKVISKPDAGNSKPDAGNKEAAGTFTGEISVTNADAGEKQAAGSFIGEISLTKAEGNKVAARSITAESGVAKAGPGNKETAGSFAGGICVTNAEPGFKKTAGSEICATKSYAGNKEAAGTGVMEADFIKFIFLTKPPADFEWKADATGINKERVPDCFIDILKKRHLLKKLPPPVTDFTRFPELRDRHLAFTRFPELRDRHLAFMTKFNYCIDLHADILRQLKEKEYAEVGVDFTDGGKKLFVLPQH